MQRTHQTQDSNTGIAETPDENILVTRKPYSQKRIRHTREKRRLSVSIKAFKTDLHIFDPEIRTKYSNTVITAVMKLIFKKVAERIVKKLWRMPFPNGIGSLYILEAQVTGISMKSDSPANLKKLLDEVHLGMKRARLKWNKQGREFPYKHIWGVKRSKGFFRSSLFSEVNDRANDQYKKSYRGHLT